MHRQSTPLPTGCKPTATPATSTPPARSSSSRKTWPSSNTPAPDNR